MPGMSNTNKCVTAETILKNTMMKMEVMEKKKETMVKKAAAARRNENRIINI